MQKLLSSKKNDKKALIAIPYAPSLKALFEKETAGFGYDVTTFKSYSGIWSFFKRETPCLVVLGNRGLKTLELCSKIRKHPAGRYTSILMMNTFKQRNDEENFLNVGADIVLHLSERSTALRGWIAAADRHVNTLLDFKECSYKIETYQKEMNFINTQLEETLTRTNQLAMEAELAYLELDQIFKTAASVILVIDKNFNILRYNEAFLRIVQLDKHEMEGKKCYETFTTRLCDSPDCPLRQIIQGRRKVELEVEKTLKDELKAFYMITSTPLRGPDADLIAVVSSIANITPRVEAERALQKKEEKFRELSIVDDLTNLYNKRHLNDLLKSEIDRTVRYERSLSLMLMDIDDFKHYNDTFGHTQGDQVLMGIGKIILKSIRKTDFGFRYGGEEFVVIMPETPGEAAVKVAERIRRKFESTSFHPTGDEEIRKTISIGVTQYLPNEKKRDLIARADQNMYQAKKMGKNQVIFS